jgi:hypothetical protein
VYDQLVRDQLAQAQAQHGEGDLADLLAAGNVWDVVG